MMNLRQSCGTARMTSLAAALFALNWESAFPMASFSVIRNVYNATLTGSLTKENDAQIGACCIRCTIDDSCTAVYYTTSTGVCTTSYGTANYTQPNNDQWTILKLPDANGEIPSSYQKISSAHIEPGQRESNDNVATLQAVNEYHCWQLCQAILSPCQLFAYNSALMSCYIYSANIYDSWTTISSTAAVWTSFYRQDLGKSKLLYKISRGIGVDASDALMIGGGNATASVQEMSMNANCSCYLKNSILNFWSLFPMKTVSVVLATNGSIKKYINFSASGRNISTFYQASAITGSSWTDLTNSTIPAIMNIGSAHTASYGRYFLILRDAYSGCHNDKGWISIHGSAASTCSYDAVPVPQFAYAPSSTYGYFVSASYADALLIYGAL